MGFDPSPIHCLIFSGVAFVIFAIIYSVKHGNIWQYLFRFALTAYLIFVFAKTLCPIYFGNSGMREAFNMEGEWHVSECIHLVPFADGISRDDLLNVVMTIPFGFILPLIRKRTSFVNALLAGLAFGLGIELLQLLIAVLQGFTFNYVDTSDVICNCLGTIIGWLIIAGIISLVKRGHSDEPETQLLGCIASREIK